MGLLAARNPTVQLWTDGHDIAISIGRVRLERPRAEYAVITASGRYRSFRTEAYNPLRIAVGGSLFWAGREPTSGLIADFSELEYTGGDGLLRCFRTPYFRTTIGNRLALVWGKQNAPHIRSLIEELEQTELLERCHFTLEESLESLLRMPTDGRSET